MDVALLGRMNLTNPLSRTDASAPVHAGASPLADDLDAVMRLEDAGAAAIVMRSMFEEQSRFDTRTRIRSIGATIRSPKRCRSSPPRASSRSRRIGTSSS